MKEHEVIIARCGDDVSLIFGEGEGYIALMSQKEALSVAQGLADKLTHEHLQMLSVSIMERLNDHLGHKSETVQ